MRITNHKGLCDGQSAFWLLIKIRMSLTTKKVNKHFITSPFDGTIRSGTTLWTTAKRCIRTLSFPTFCTTSLVRKRRKTQCIIQFKHLWKIHPCWSLELGAWSLMVRKKNEKKKKEWMELKIRYLRTVSKFDRWIDLIEHGDCSFVTIPVYPWSYPCTMYHMKIYFSSFLFNATQAAVKCLWESLGTRIPYLNGR